MRLRLVAVGTRMPAWVEAGFEEYRKRMPRECPLDLVEVPLAKRGKSGSAGQWQQEEGEGILQQIRDRDWVVALDVKGKSWSTPQLSERIGKWQMSGQDVVLMVGGPDGLSEACLHRAQERWSLSALTLPHPLVRVMLSEQLYRAWSLLQGHPYHRE